ncbi:TIGR02647 family protein [Enterovibrio norvegicus FF-33]|uniref:TIGR02647 family protein n=1 Tax=Enterovibrio norvegicus FF-454 TaxID=1185651 RepID=A0A1E5BZX1_9GAMM|nr:TIGR02647 family protein [Enterovibrio norvegicus]OEE58814.1 TIGR02647 family protein [Enterovibrio norvegicus FF-454]OEE68031.1 TIGR02647 family protein [Enterovibrio norvegicus FF-33]OEE74165.1 TIGR02647 family protein [Enterovibrio norvegicus FF-162]
MLFTSELLEEMNVLVKFTLSTDMAGLKVRSDADPILVAATERLYDKKLVTAKDGGYLTSIGRDAVEHAKEALRILRSEP